MPVTDLSRIFKAYDVRGLYGDDIDGDTAEAVGRGLARALADLSGKPASELKVGLGRDMRLSAPELARRYRAGLMAEGAHVVDAGMVGTEMVYWLVGSRDLDGGLMCTASHNPKAYTGAKMVERGSVALSGDRGLAEVRAHIENGLGEAPGGGSYEEVDIYEDFQREALKVIDTERDPAAEGRRRRRQRDGGADGRPDPRHAADRARRPPTGCPTASSPTTSPTRCCPRTASSSSAR